MSEVGATFDRDTLGRIVRAAWMGWARNQPDPKPSWLLPWEQLGEADREADRCIGEAVANAVLLLHYTSDEQHQQKGELP